MKFTSTLGGIGYSKLDQQETTATSVTRCLLSVSDYNSIDTVQAFVVHFNYQQFPHGA